MGREILGLSSMATSRVLAELANEVVRVHGIDLRFGSAGGVEVARRVREGAEVDVLVLDDGLMAELEREGLLIKGSVKPLFVSEVVAAIPSTLEAPAFDTEADVVHALSVATRIGYSTGPSGTAVLRLVEQWGLTDRLVGRLVRASTGVPVSELLVRGQAQLGFQQLSELMDVPGVRVVGPLPGEARIRSVFSCGILAASTRPAATCDALSRLVRGSANEITRTRGMELVAAK